MPRPRRHDDALRARLLEVTSEAVAVGGERAVTVRSVATAAGTSGSAVYALFGSREELVAAVSAEGFRRFGAHLAAAPRGDDPLADLLALGLAYRGSAVADPQFYRVMFDRAVPPADGSPGSPAPPPTRRPTFVVLRDAVARVRGASDARAEGLAVALWGLAHGLVSLELAGLLPGTDEERAARYAAALGALGPALLAGD